MYLSISETYQNSQLVLRVERLQDAVKQREEQLLRLSSQLSMLRNCADEHSVSTYKYCSSCH